MKILFVAMIFLVGCSDHKKQAATPANSESAVKMNIKGEQLFKIKCAQCHMPAKDFAAPALAGVEKRWTNKKLLYDFIRNSQQVIAKDKYAADLFEKWKQAPMLPFPDLTNAEIDAILEYCNQAASLQ